MQNKLTIQLLIAATIGTLVYAGPSAAAMKRFSPVQDTTIFSEAEDESDGSGIAFRAGLTGDNASDPLRRALIKFDVSSLPLNAVIQTVSLAMWRTGFNPGGPDSTNMSLHKVLEDWGSIETGDPTQPGDATWRYAFLATDEWSKAGGAYASGESASVAVGAPEQVYTWSSGGMVLDVQFWVKNGGNFGWILLGDEASPFSVREFASSNTSDSSFWPGLTVTYTIAVPEPATFGMLLAGLMVLLAVSRKRFG